MRSYKEAKKSSLAITKELSFSGWADLNRRPQVPQTCTLNPCATARLARWNHSIGEWKMSNGVIADFAIMEYIMTQQNELRGS